MKRLIAILLTSLFISGFAGCPEKEKPIATQPVNIPVFQKPEFDQPVRPILNSENISDTMTDGEVARIIEGDFLKLKTYGDQQQKILDKLKK